MKYHPYKLSDPDRISILPVVLKEISGISRRDDSSIVCIEDDIEVIYIYDLNKDKILRKLPVGGKGDFEGVARVGMTVYILRSDGLISEIENYESENYIKKSYATGVPWKDNEGLCYDKQNNRLLIGPKSIPGKKSSERGFRYIYGFNLFTKKLEKKPAFVFDMSAIKNFAEINNIRLQGKDAWRNIKFRISALGIHPITNSLYVVSSRDRLLYIFDRNGNIMHIENLDRKLFWQPEGITFMENGDMIISNEGKKKKKKPPSLVRFNYNHSG